jgi:hypothetical protein
MRSKYVPPIFESDESKRGVSRETEHRGQPCPSHELIHREIGVDIGNEDCNGERGTMQICLRESQRIGYIVSSFFLQIFLRSLPTAGIGKTAELLPLQAPFIAAPSYAIMS